MTLPLIQTILWPLYCIRWGDGIQGDSFAGWFG